MIIKPETINVEDCFHSPLANLAKQGTQEQYKDNYSVGSFIVGGAIRVISLAAYVPASILDLVLSPFIDLAIFFGAITNSESLTQANTNLTNANGELRTANTNLGNANGELRTANTNLGNANEELRTANTNLSSANQRLQQENDQLNNRISFLSTDNEKLTNKNADLNKLNESFQRVSREKNRLDAENEKLQELNKKWMGLSIKLLNQDMQSKKTPVESALHVDKNIQSKVIASAGGLSERYTPSDLVVNNRIYPEETENKHSNLDLDEELPALEPQHEEVPSLEPQHEEVPRLEPRLRYEDRDSAYREALEKLDTVSELINGPTALDHQAPAATPEAQRATSEAYTAVKVAIFINAVYVLGFATYAYYQKDIDQYLMAQANAAYGAANSVINQWKEMPNSSSIIDAAINYTDKTVKLVKDFPKDAFNAAEVFPNFSAQVVSNTASALASGVSNLKTSIKNSATAVGQFFNEENANTIKNGAFSFGSSILFGAKTKLVSSFEGAKNTTSWLYNQLPPMYSRNLTEEELNPTATGAEGFKINATSENITPPRIPKIDVMFLQGKQQTN